MFFCLKTHLLYMNRLPFLGLLFALLCLVSCRQMNDVRLLHLAEEQNECGQYLCFAVTDRETLAALG